MDYNEEIVKNQKEMIKLLRQLVELFKKYEVNYLEELEKAGDRYTPE